MTPNTIQRLVGLGAAVVLALLLLVPTAFRGAAEFWPLSRPLSLGLDLSGGVHLVYEVEAPEAVKSALQTQGNQIRASLRDEKIAVLRARAPDSRTLEITALSDAMAEKAKASIDRAHPKLSLVEKAREGANTVLRYKLSDAEAGAIEARAVDQAVETLRNRVDQFGVAEPLIQRVGGDRILLQMPGVSDIEKVKKVIGSVAKLEFRLVPERGDDGDVTELRDREGSVVRVEGQALMTGEAVDTARVHVEAGNVEVSLSLTSEGARTFRRLTSENVGRQLAIVLDDVVYSHPVIRDTIGGGQASISGGFSVEEATRLAVVLRAGALPAPLRVVEERTVGPSLGRESIKSGVTAIAAGFGAIMACMLFYYRKAGAVAVATLALNLLLILASLSLFGATLTLPGLAGLALSVGMAVDSNVIIFERIRDELRGGAKRDAAVRAGFHKAWSAIIDTNLTVLFSAFIMYFFGTGPIRGFAVTLSVGVLTTMFCAVFAAKVLFDVFELRGPDRLSI